MSDRIKMQKRLTERVWIKMVAVTVTKKKEKKRKFTSWTNGDCVLGVGQRRAHSPSGC